MDQKPPFTADIYRKLADKWVKGTITEEERKIFNEWYDQFQDEQAIIENGPFSSEEQLKDYLFDQVRQVTEKKERRKAINPLWIRAAAIVMLISGILFMLYPEHHETKKNTSKAISPTAAPSGIELTLGNGQHIMLDKIKKGVIHTEEGIVVKQDQKGQLVFQVQHKGGLPIDTNTIQIPKQTQYQLILADQTKVWLNASSKLRFPSSFDGDERCVQLEGEAYFEVAENANKPFSVITKRQEIQVLGTAFNVHAYADETAVSTTLISGSVRVKHSTANTDKQNYQYLVLHPGEQIALSGAGSRVQRVNIQDVIAWKDGLFVFKNTPLTDMMATLSKWYPIDIVYEQGVGKEVFNGEINKNYTLEELLEVLHAGGINCALNGQQLIVKP